MRLLICAGGTGGGVYPALSVLQALQTSLPVSTAEPGMPALSTLWVGGEGGMEAELVKRAGVDFASIPAAGLHGVGLRALPANLLKLARGLWASCSILRRFRPQVLFFTGGYVAAPMALAARLMPRKQRPPSLVYIPDIEPGLALKFLLRLVNCAALTCEDSRSFLPRSLDAKVTGYPARAELAALASAPGALGAARQALGLPVVKELPTLLVWGGSKGARSLNRALLASLTQLLPDMEVVHISGQLDWQDVSTAAAALPCELAARYRAFPYLHAEMGAALSSADLVVSRAGASSLGEYPLFGLPAILAPYPYAWRYQRVNAEYLVTRGAAILVKDEDLLAQLLPQVRSLMAAPERRQSMRRAMQSLAAPQAAESIAGLLQKLAAQGAQTNG